MSNQQLGPLQLAWVESLESGEIEQTIGSLVSIPTDGDWCQCCCLGVAALVCEANGMKLNWIKREAHWCLSKNHWGLPSSDVVKAMKFHDDNGSFAGDHALGGLDCLVEANDCGATFPEIAAFARQHPDAIFSESA